MIRIIGLHRRMQHPQGLHRRQGVPARMRQLPLKADDDSHGDLGNRAHVANIGQGQPIHRDCGLHALNLWTTLGMLLAAGSAPNSSTALLTVHPHPARSPNALPTLNETPFGNG